MMKEKSRSPPKLSNGRLPLILAVREVPAIPPIVKGKINAYAPLTIRVLAGCWQTSQNKQKSAV